MLSPLPFTVYYQCIYHEVRTWTIPAPTLLQSPPRARAQDGSVRPRHSKTCILIRRSPGRSFEKTCQTGIFLSLSAYLSGIRSYNRTAGNTRTPNFAKLAFHERGRSRAAISGMNVSRRAGEGYGRGQALPWESQLSSNCRQKGRRLGADRLGPAWF